MQLISHEVFSHALTRALPSDSLTDDPDVLFHRQGDPAECLSIFDKKKVDFDFKNLFDQIRKSENHIIIPLDNKILLPMAETQEVSELHDKIIAATAKILKTPLITKDSVLVGLKTITTVW